MYDLWGLKTMIKTLYNKHCIHWSSYVLGISLLVIQLITHYISKHQDSLEEDSRSYSSAWNRGRFQCLHTLIWVESLPGFDSIWSSMGTITNSHLKEIITGLGNFFSVNGLTKKNRVMRRSIIKLHSLNIMNFASRLTEINEYLGAFPYSNTSNNIGES